MANNSDSSMHDFGVSLMNWSWSGDSTAEPSYGLSRHFILVVKYRQSKPIVLMNSIFSNLYAIGILANLLLLVYIIYYKRYKTPVFCVISSLGAADLCVCGCVFLYHKFVSPYILGPLWLCNVVLGVRQVALFSSSYHIAVFAVLRFMQLVYPLASHAKVNTSLLSKVCLTIWAIFSTQGVARSLTLKSVNISPTESSHIYMCLATINQHGRYVYNIWIIIVWMIVPFIITTGFHVAKQVSVTLSHSANVSSQDKRDHQVRRHTDSRSLALVIVIYIASMFPVLILNFRYHVFGKEMTQLDKFIFDICANISFSNSAINPFIYLFAAESVRSDIRKMITCNRWMNKNSAGVS